MTSKTMLIYQIQSSTITSYRMSRFEGEKGEGEGSCGDHVLRKEKQNLLPPKEFPLPPDRLLSLKVKQMSQSGVLHPQQKLTLDD